MASEARALGMSIEEYKRLAQERATDAARLERELSACGNCAQRQRLESELATLRRTERNIRLAEADTLTALGLGHYGSFDEMFAALAQSLGAQVDIGTQYSRDKVRETVLDHCRGLSADSSADPIARAMAAGHCAGALKPERQLAGFRLALNYCQRVGNDSFVSLCRDPRTCDAFEQCMRSNSEVVALCAANQAKGIATRKPGRCFASMIHPQIFTASNAGGGSRVPPVDRQAQARDRTCQTLAERIERMRDAAAQSTSDRGPRAALANLEKKYSASCKPP